MPYVTVTDPKTGEKRTVWKDQASLKPGEYTLAVESEKGFLDANEEDNFLVGTAKAVPRMFINAGINAVQEGSDTIRDIGGAFGIGEGTTRAEPDKPILGFGDWKPETLDSSGVVEDIGTGILQFGLEWVLLAKGLKGANLALKATSLGKPLTTIGAKAKNIQAGAIALAGKSPIAPKAAQSLTKFGSKVLTETSPRAAVIDFAGFDQYEGRLYDLVTEADKWDVIEKIPLLKILETNPEDEGLQGRAKNALEGFFIDLGIGGVISARSVLKIRKAKRLAKELAETPKGSAEYNELLPKVIQQGEELEKIPEIKRALTEQQKEARVDRAAFDKGLAHLPPAERDRLWKLQRIKRGLVVEQPEFYHGTPNSIAAKIQKEGFKESDGLYGPGIYITSKKTAATNWGGSSMMADINYEDFVDLGDFPKGNNKAIDALYSQARTLRGQGQNVLVKNHPQWGDLAIVGKDLADQKFTSSIIKEKKGVPNVTLKGESFSEQIDDLIRQQNELGPEPPKPAKGKSIVNGKQTEEYKTWMRWNRRKKALDAKGAELDELYKASGEAEREMFTDLGPENETFIDPTGKTNEEMANEIYEQLHGDAARQRDLREEGIHMEGGGWVDADGNPAGPEKVAEIQAAQAAFKERVETLANLLERGDLPYFRRKTSMRKKGVDEWGDNVYDYKQDIVRDDDIAIALINGKSFSEIIDGLKANNPRNAGLGEGKVSLSHHRGADNIKEALRAHIGKQDLDVEDVRTIEKFIDMIGDSMFDDVAFSFFQKIKAQGRFNFANKLLEINSRIIGEGTFTRTMVHELWHSLSRYLPEKDLIAYTKEFEKAKTNYVKKLETRVQDFGEELKVQNDFVEKHKSKLNDIQTKVDELLVKQAKGKLTRKEGKRLAALSDAVRLITEFDTEVIAWGKLRRELDNFKEGKFTEENYRFSEVDEYFAEMLTDQLFLKHWKKADLAPSGTFTRMIQEIGLVFKDLWINLKAQLGGPRTEKIFNDFLKGRNTEKLREYSFDIASKPEDLAAYKEQWRTLAGDILEGADVRRVVSPDEPLVQILYRDLLATREKYMPYTRKGRPEIPDPWSDSPRDMGDLPEDVLRSVRDVVEGKKPLLESAGMWDIEQDVTKLRSPLKPGGKGNRYYSAASEEGSDFEIILNAISKRWDRVELTGMESLSGREIAQELESIFRREGMNLEEILYDEKIIGATEVFRNNRENITNLIKLKFALNFSSEQAAKWATESFNAMHNPRIDRNKAIIEMHRNLNTALQFAQVYEIWTRHAGQLLQAAQTQVNAQGISETLKRQDLGFDNAAAIAEAAKMPADIVFQNLPPEYLDAVRTGNWTPKSESFLFEIQGKIMDTDTAHGLKSIQDLLGKPDAKEGIKKSKKIDNYEKKTKGLAVYYINNILSGAKTWAVQLSGLGRTLIEPTAMAVTSGNYKIATLQYDYMVRTFYGSLKLGQKSWLTGQALYDPKIRTGAWSVDLAGDLDMNSAYAKNRAYQLDDIHPSYDLNKTPFFLKEMTNNPAYHAANVLWKLGTWNIRGQAAMDTFIKSLAGNSFIHAIGVEEGLTQGAAKGLKGKRLKQYAEEWADGKIEFYTFDAVINGETIADAVMKDESAIQIGRILTFTDEVRAKMPTRSKKYGMELARQRGMTDPAEIEEFARRYRNGELEGAQKLWNNFTRSADGIVQRADNLEKLPDVGGLTPTLTSSWSQVPQFWGKMQSARHGYLASFIQPFNRSPGDITKQWVRMIPGLNMTVDTFYRDLFNENAYLKNRWKAEIAIGTSASALFATTVLHNDEFPIEFTGYGPNGAQMRKEWSDAERPPLSWRTRRRDTDGNWVYGQWHSYRGFEPAATFIAGLADYKMLYADMSEIDRDNLVGGFSASIAAQVMLGRFNATYYKGIVEFIDAVADVIPFTNGGFMRREKEPSERNKLARYVQRFITNFIPESSRMREVSRAMDRYKRTIDSSVNPIEAFKFADEGLVKARDGSGSIVYLEKADANLEEGNPFMTWIAGFWRQQIDEIKNTIPGFSEELPERINWITGLPIRNAGFLGSNQLPYDDAPWLSRLTGAYFGTLFGAVSEFGFGPKGHVFDPRTAKQKANGTITKEYMAALVNDEMIKISRAGGTFPPPRPTDFGKGIRLSAPAFRKYKEYIYTVEIGGQTLLEAIYSRMKSKSYQQFDYVIHPTKDTRGKKGFVKADYIQEIITLYKNKAKDHFRRDINNKYRMEVILIERQIEATETKIEEQKRDLFYGGSSNIDLNAEQFSAQLNQ